MWGGVWVTRACVLARKKFGLESTGHRVPQRSKVGELEAQISWRTIYLIRLAGSVSLCSCSLPGCPSGSLNE